MFWFRLAFLGSLVEDCTVISEWRTYTVKGNGDRRKRAGK